MKKFYAIVAAALMSASMFATVPTATDLANANYDVTNNVVLCVNFVEDAKVCNDIYFCGTPNNWAESFDGCPKFKALAGFDGWYAAEATYVAGFQAKPIQAKSDGSFSWDFQTGDPGAWAHMGGLEATIENGFDNEANVSFGAAGAYIYEVSYWKKHKTPCTVAVKHKYTVKLYAPECTIADYEPAAIGDFNNWAEGAEMAADLDDNFETFYKIVIEDEEGHELKFRQKGISDWSNQLQYLDGEEWKDCGNVELPAATQDTTIVIDYSDTEKFRWTKCDMTPEEAVLVILKAPVGAPAEIEVIGEFDDWGGTPMLNIQGNEFQAAIAAKPAQKFKFRSGIGEDGDAKWANGQPEKYNADGAKWEQIELKFKDVWEEGEGDMAGTKVVNLDFSDPAVYRWSAAQGIEDIVLTEKAQKVMVDGVLYIVRDNKMFNVQGAQVR